MFQQYRQIGDPVFRMSDELFDGEIRLEGAEVSREEYAKLFEVYGITYGEGNGSTTFNLPDFRDRAIWGGIDYGYIEAGLPDHRHKVTMSRTKKSGLDTATVWSWNENRSGTGSVNTDYASSTNSLYGKSTTVQPPAIKVRVITRYK